MIRFERVLALMLPSLLACGPAVGSLSVHIDTDVLPDEVAFQDGEGPWRVVQLVDGAADLPVTDPAGRYGIATSNQGLPGHATKSTIWQQSSFIIRSSASFDWRFPVEVQRRVSLSGLKPGAPYSVHSGYSAPREFFATASAQVVSFSSFDDREDPLVVLERTNVLRAFVFTGFHDGDSVALEGGVVLEELALPVKGLAASDRVFVYTSCSFASSSGATGVELNEEAWGEAFGFWLPSVPRACEHSLQVTRGNFTWHRSLDEGEAKELPEFTMRFDQLAGSASWTPGSIDTDSRVALSLGSLNIEVTAGWRRGASSVQLGDASAAPLLFASTRTGRGVTVSANARPWSLHWQDDHVD